MPNKVWDNTTHSFPYINYCTIEIRNGYYSHPTLHDKYDYFLTLEPKLTHVIKRTPDYDPFLVHRGMLTVMVLLTSAPKHELHALLT